jgi:hypothetical protein
MCSFPRPPLGVGACQLDQLAENDRRHHGRADAGSGSSGGASSLYMTGVTRRAMSVLLTNPPMMTHASGE